MASAKKLFASENISQYYVKFRPKPPAELIDRIVAFINAKLSPPFHQAVDIGCGSGQSTVLLAPYFENVLGIDVSEALINQACKQEHNKNVSYKVGSSEEIPVQDNSVQLITVSQALHWFDIPLFFKEVDRILSPGGVLAVYGYDGGFPRPINFDSANEVVDLLQHIYDVDTAGYWHKSKAIYDEGYRNIKFPYEENVREEFCTEQKDWSVAALVGLIQSWSGIQSFVEDKPEKAKEVINSFQNNVMKAMHASLPPEEVKFDVQYHYTLIMCRKPL